MDDRTITVSISEDEQAFIDAKVASGRYTDGSEVLRAGLAALEFAEAIRMPEDSAAVGDFGEPSSLARYVSDNAPQLKRTLEASEASGKSARTVLDIMAAVKSKLRANGPL